MNRLTICTLLAFVVAAILHPAAIHAGDEDTVGEAPQPILIQQLTNPVPINFEANRLVNVMDYFWNTTGFRIEVDWPELKKWNVQEDVLITLTLSNVPPSRSIELTMHEAAGNRLALLLDNGERLHVTMRRKAEHLIETDPERWLYWHAAPRTPQDDKPNPYDVADVRMNKPIPWNFKRNRIANILDYIRHVVDINLYIDWKSIGRVQVDQDTLFTGTGDTKPASEVLDTVLTAISDDLAWRIDDFGIVIVSTRDVIDEMFPATDEPDDADTDPDE